VFQFTQRAIENRSTCHAWHARRRLPTPGLHIPAQGPKGRNSNLMTQNMTDKGYSF